MSAKPLTQQNYVECHNCGLTIQLENALVHWDRECSFENNTDSSSGTLAYFTSPTAEPAQPGTAISAGDANTNQTVGRSSTDETITPQNWRAMMEKSKEKERARRD